MKTDLAKKNILRLGETVEYFNLSRQKFYAMLKKTTSADFLVYYRKYKLILKEPFEEFLKTHPELRRQEL